MIGVLLGLALILVAALIGGVAGYLSEEKGIPTLFFLLVIFLLVSLIGAFL